jgi:hypothetical protein
MTNLSEKDRNFLELEL